MGHCKKILKRRKDLLKKYNEAYKNYKKLEKRLRNLEDKIESQIIFPHSKNFKRVTLPISINFSGYED